MNETYEQYKQLLDKLHTLMLERWESYQGVQDFNKEGAPSKARMKLLKDKTSDVNRVHNQVNKLREALGHDRREIKEQDVRRIMNPNGEDPRCSLLFSAGKTIPTR